MANESLYHINQIKIMMKLNRKDHKEFTPFTFSMLAHPDLEGMTGNNYTYPYFTNSVTYPYMMLANRDYKYIVEFFFDRDRFEKVLRKYEDGYVDENDLFKENVIMNEVFKSKSEFSPETQAVIDQLDYNIEYNIDCMLKLLFPINHSFSSVYTNSFHHNIYGSFNSNVFYIDIKRPFWGGNTSYIKHGGTDFIVSGVEWLNDIINHPIYFKFLRAYNNSLEQRTKSDKRVELSVNDKYFEYANVLYPLYNTKSKYKDALTSLADYDKYATSVNIDDNAFDLTSHSHFFTDMYVELSVLLQNTGNTTTSQSASLRKSILTELKQKIQPFAGVGELNQFMRSSDIQKDKKINRSSFLKKINEAKPLFSKLANTIIQTYLELSGFNSKSDYKINLKQEISRQLSTLYNLSIGLKAVGLVDDFIHLRIRKLDMNEKNADGTTKLKEELDIIKSIQTNYSQYAKMSNIINDSIADITRPKRETSNLLLRNEINKIRLPSSIKDDAENANNPCYKNFDFFRDVYAKYMHPYRKKFQKTSAFDVLLMYVGVNTLGETYEKESSATLGEQTNEIYVLLDVVDRKKYESNKHRCNLEDDILTNELNSLMSSRHDKMVNEYRE